MRLLLITLVAAVIAGCGFNKPILMMPEFPTPIKELTEKCNELKLIEATK